MQTVTAESFVRPPIALLIANKRMDLNTTSKNIHWIEVVVAVFFVGLVLVFTGSVVRSALVRERDAMRLVSIAATRGALEHYGASKGGYPITDKPVLISGGCIDADQGVVMRTDRAKCSAAIVGVPDEPSSSYGIYYQSTADGKGYALSVRQEQSVSGRMVCATTAGIALTNMCAPIARQALR